MDKHPLLGKMEAEWIEVQDGEVWSYRVSASPYLPQWQDVPFAQQAVRLESWVWDKRAKEERYSVHYALTSLGPEQAKARHLGELLRRRWGGGESAFLAAGCALA